VGNNTTLQAALWAANAVALGFVYIIDRNLKLENKLQADAPSGTVRVDLSGEKPIEVAYQQKMIPEFTIYHV
jgi:hypothetical protein